MAHFVKGQGLVRTSFKSNVELRSANVDFVAGKYIINPRSGFAEGLSSVTVNDESIGKALITNPASLTEVHLPAEYTAIGPKAFDGCANLTGIYVYAGQVISISEDAIPSGCAVYVDYEFVTEYQTLHPTLDIRGFDSGYVWEVPYTQGVTPTTLTAQYIEDCVAELGDSKDSVGKVIVPAGFTEYEGGALNEIFTQFANLQELESPWLNGDITEGFIYSFVPSVATITSETLSNLLSSSDGQHISSFDRATYSDIAENAISTISSLCPNLTELSVPFSGGDIVFGLSNWSIISFDGNVIDSPIANGATEIALGKNADDNYHGTGLSDYFTTNYPSIKFLPYIAGRLATGVIAREAFSGLSSLVYSPALDLSGSYYKGMMFANCHNLEYVADGINTGALGQLFRGCEKLKRIPFVAPNTDNSWYYAFNNCSSAKSVPAMDASLVVEGQWSFGGIFGGCTSMESILITNIKANLNISQTALGHDALIIVIGNLVDVGESRTLTIGSAKLALLSQAEIDVATAKGWTLQ